MEGRDTASFPPSACPLQRGGEMEARLGRKDGDGADAALVRSLTDTAAAQLCTAALVLVLGQRGGQSCRPDLAKSETSAQLIPDSFRLDLRPKACVGCWDLPGWRGGGRVGSFQFLMSYQGKDLVGPKKTVTTSSKMPILTDDGQLRQSDHVWPPTSMALRGTWGFTLLCQGLKSALSVTVSDWLKSPTRWLIRTVRFYLSPIKDNFNSPANRIGHSGSFA